MPREERTPSVSRSRSKTSSGSSTSIERVDADEWDRDAIREMRKVMAQRLMNVQRYESLVEALADEPDQKLIDRLDATLGIARELYNQTRKKVRTSTLIRQYNKANKYQRFGDIVRRDARQIDARIAEEGTDQIHFKTWVDRHMSQRLPRWEFKMPKNEKDENRKERKRRARAETEAFVGAYGTGYLQLTDQQEEDYLNAEKLLAEDRDEARRQREMDEREEAVRAALARASATDPDATPLVVPQRGSTPIPEYLLPESRRRGRSPTQRPGTEPPGRSPSAPRSSSPLNPNARQGRSEER